MCDICGVLNLSPSKRTVKVVIQQMLAMIRHREPDGFGIYSDENIALSNARLSIIDLDTGDQPISNENETLWIILNGEIFNYVELRQDLERRGHRSKTKSDTETLLHTYEEFGVACLERLNGQFSLAIWDNVNHSLFLAKDRLGNTPLFYCIHEKKLVFGSEIKALLAYPGLRVEIDPIALQQVFTFWSVQSPKSIFQGINEIPPRHYLITNGDQISVKSFWSLDIAQQKNIHSEREYLEELESSLIDSVRLRLRSDVPVGVYLSGGLNSSLVTSLIRKHSNYPLESYSISFSDPEFDESHFEVEVANYFNARHHVIHCSYEDIGHIFPDVVWHTETPILRTAPAPMFLLSKLVRDNGYKAVLTGGGADEFFAGYDIFKEMQVRRFWARNPESSVRPLLFKRLYNNIEGFSIAPIEYLTAFFKKGLMETDSKYSSHTLRWNNTARNTSFLRDIEKIIQTPFDTLPKNYVRWSQLSKAQYLEIVSFLSPYLFSSQGDRMAMGHSVEERHQYLDYRLVEFCNHLPDRVKLNGLKEKWLLKRLGAKLLPASIWKKGKKPYRAPINQCFFTKPLDYIKELLSEINIQDNNYYNSKAVMASIQKASTSNKLDEINSMALAGIISTQLLHQLFVKNFRLKPIISPILKYIER